MHKKVKAPVSMGTTRLGKMPNEVDVCRHRSGTEGLSNSGDTIGKSRSSSRLSTVRRLWPLGSIATVVAWSS